MPYGIEKKKLPQLPLKTSIADTDIFHVNSSAIDYKIDSTVITDYVLGPIQNLVKHSSTFITTSFTGSASLIPFDDSKPLSGEGIPFFARSTSVVSASNILLVRVLVNFSTSASNCHLIASLFSNRAPDPNTSIATATEYSTNANAITQLEIFTIISPAAYTSINFTIWGGASVASTVYFNSTSAGRVFGGNLKSFIEIYEIAP